MGRGEHYLGVAALGEDGLLRSIGVDVEWAGREVHSSTLRHMGHPQDGRDFLPLERWVAKEAAYKALWPLWPQAQLSQIQILRHRFSFGETSGALHLANIRVGGECAQLALAAIFRGQNSDGP